MPVIPFTYAPPVFVLDTTKLKEGVCEGVIVGVGVGDDVTVTLGDMLGVTEDVGVCVMVTDGVTVGVTVLVGVTDGVILGVGVGLGLIAEGDGVGGNAPSSVIVIESV